MKVDSIDKKQKVVDPLFDPSCCTYKLNGDIRNHVQRLIDSGKQDSRKGQIDSKPLTILKDLLDQEEANKGTMSYESLSELHKYMQRADKSYLDPFYMLLERCKCIWPKQRENKQLEARLKRLRLRCSQQMYDRMASSVDRVVENKTSSSPVSDFGGAQKELKLLNGSFMAVINSFLVYICTFIFCYKALEYSLGEPHIVGQVLFGLLGSTIVACAELYFLVRVI